MDENEELEGSELGTKSYWDDSYSTEMKNFRQSGDIGEIWFGEDSMFRIVRWICRNKTIQLTDFIIDMGCGNGIMLIELAREGYKNLVGVDYSKPAIELAMTIGKIDFPDIHYEVLDILIDDIIEHTGKYKIVHDKGTYDAISLHPDDPKTNRELYIERIKELMMDDGVFIITSCNWTENELCVQFKDTFVLKELIPTPQFKFGGKIGNVVTSAIFQKV